jgi:hypothetical protein
VKINNILASCGVYGSGSIEEAHVDFDEFDKTTHDITDNTHKVSSADDNRHETFGTLISTAAIELNNQNIERLPTGSTNLEELLDGGIDAGVILRFRENRVVEKRNPAILCQQCYLLLTGRVTLIPRAASDQK